ncbi:uncharacterized [Tachysurus ichikawai]
MSMLKRSWGQRIILSNFPINCPPIGSLGVIIVDARSTGFSCAVGSGAWDRCSNPPAGPACLSPMIRAGARANVGNALLMTEPSPPPFTSNKTLTLAPVPQGISTTARITAAGEKTEPRLGGAAVIKSQRRNRKRLRVFSVLFLLL